MKKDMALCELLFGYGAMIDKANLKYTGIHACGRQWLYGYKISSWLSCHIEGIRPRRSSSKHWTSTGADITDERLQQIDIDFPYNRKRMLFGLLQFYEHPWSKDSLIIQNFNANIVWSNWLSLNLPSNLLMNIRSLPPCQLALNRSKSVWPSIESCNKFNKLLASLKRSTHWQ